jgi:TonB family protein
LKRIYSERKFLIIGIAVSLIVHILFFSVLYFTKTQKKEEKKEEPIKISLIPYEKVSKVQKNVGKKNILKKKIRKKVIKKKISKPRKKIVKKIPKKIKKKMVKKEIKKPEKTIEKVVKKQKPFEKKPTIKEEVKKIPKKEVVKKPKLAEKKVPVKKEIKPVEKSISENIENPSPKKLIIPDLSKTFKKQPEKKNKEKDKAVIDYLKYIKIEFEKNKFYPDKAKKLGIEGVVVLKFTILPDGTIDKNSIQVVEADHPFLARGAVRIFEKIKKLKKPPPNGKKMTVEIPIQYILYEIY